MALFQLVKKQMNPTYNGNNFFGLNSLVAGAEDVNMGNNWWNTTNTSVIDSIIHDYTDDDGIPGDCLIYSNIAISKNLSPVKLQGLMKKYLIVMVEGMPISQQQALTTQKILQQALTTQKILQQALTTLKILQQALTTQKMELRFLDIMSTHPILLDYGQLHA